MSPSTGKGGPVSLQASYFPVALVTTLVIQPYETLFSASFSSGDSLMACLMYSIRHICSFPKLISALSKYPWRNESPILRPSSGSLRCLLRQSNSIQRLCSETLGIQMHIYVGLDTLRDWSNLFLAMCQIPIVCGILCRHFCNWIGTWYSGNRC
jgi:hypothetical protein